jgi:hypothetical protein
MPNRNPRTTPAQRRHDATLKLEILRQHIKAGVDALDRGDFIEIDGANLEDFLKPPCNRRRPRGRRRS